MFKFLLIAALIGLIYLCRNKLLNLFKKDVAQVAQKVEVIADPKSAANNAAQPSAPQQPQNPPQQ